jgi:hypothetical protein
MRDHKFTGVLSIKQWNHQALLTSMNSDIHCVLQTLLGSMDPGEKLQLRPACRANAKVLLMDLLVYLEHLILCKSTDFLSS